MLRNQLQRIMDKSKRYLKSFFFGIAALSIIDFMTRNGLDSAARYQYRDFEFGFLFRNIADFILFGSLVCLLINEWFQSFNGRTYKVISCLYIGLILVDINIWIWWTQYSWLYYYITIVHSIPILILSSRCVVGIKMKRILLTGLTFLLLGFLFNIIFNNIAYPDMTDELYQRTLRVEKIRNMIYYFGIIFISIAVIFQIKRIKAPINIV